MKTIRDLPIDLINFNKLEINEIVELVIDVSDSNNNLEQEAMDALPVFMTLAAVTLAKHLEGCLPSSYEIMFEN